MKKLFKIISGLLVITVILILIVHFSVAKNELKIYVFDVGQGDGILIRTPDQQNIVIDGGPDNSFITKLGQALPFYDRTIDLMILTHAHDDHLFGLVEVLKRYRVERILSSGALHVTDAYLEWLDLIQKKQIPLTVSLSGQEFFFGPVRLEVVYPLTELTDLRLNNLNDGSIVIRLVYQESTFLFMGDLEAAGEEEILAQYPKDLKARVLKLGHHGSDTSSIEDFLKAVNPKQAVISVGENKFGHPHEETLERLKDIKIYQTIDGTVIINDLSS